MAATTSSASAPYPTKSPRNAKRAAPCVRACARHASSAWMFAWMSAKSAMRIGRSARVREDLGKVPPRAPEVASAEQIQVVENVIEIVERASHRITAVERPSLAIGGLEGVAEAAEQLGHGNVGLAIARVDRGIEHDRRAVSQASGIAGPPIAVQKRRRGIVAAQKRR